MDAPLHIAIDGPVGAGKSEISKNLAAQLGFVYLYTGAMYRALAYECLRDTIIPTNEAAVLEKLQQVRIDLFPPTEGSEYPVRVRVNDKDVTNELFSPQVDKVTPIVSSIAQVRRIMVVRQQELAKGKNIVMEGRDIGLRVLPNAQLKVYLTASVEERSRRRWKQFLAKGINKTLEEVVEDTKRRDEQDMNRQTDPLQKLPDSWELDTTGMTQDQVLKHITQELKNRKLLS